MGNISENERGMRKILIVDDEPNNRFLMEDLLSVYRSQGIELLFAEDGEEALKLIVTQDPQIVFLDVVLPERDGYDVCRYIRQELQKKNSYIVLLTAKSRESDSDRAMEMGADEMIRKPFKAQALFDVVNKVFGTRS
jgi:two-component system, OmpR family, alkaline phosphatase synthesis response regulator PhoP